MVDAVAEHGRVEQDGARLGESVEVQILRRAGDGEGRALGELDDGGELPPAESLAEEAVLVPEPGRAVCPVEGEAVRRVEAREATRVARVVARLVGVARPDRRRF